MRKDIKLIMVMLLMCTLIGIASASTSNPQGGSNNPQVSTSAPPSSADAMVKTSMQGENSQSEAEKVASFFDRPSASSTAKASEDTTKTYSRSHVEDSSNKASRDEDATTSASGNTNKASRDEDATTSASGNTNKQQGA